MEKMKREGMTKGVFIRVAYAAVIVAVGVIVMLCMKPAVAHGVEQHMQKETESYLASFQEPMRDAIRKELVTSGFCNAGITVTHLVEDDNWTYCVKIHHSLMGNLSSGDCDLMLEQIKEVMMQAASSAEDLGFGIAYNISLEI